MSRDEKLRIIGQQIQHWLDWNEGDFERSGSGFNDDSHVMPPTWPTRGQLKNWCAVLFNDPAHD